MFCVLDNGWFKTVCLFIAPVCLCVDLCLDEFEEVKRNVRGREDEVKN